MLWTCKLGFYSTFGFMQTTDEKYMKRALQLAEKGRFTVAPNPRVGCVIVHKKRIIGEGFHQHFGGAHAEVNAIASVKDKSLLEQATLYVTLEPCAHYGKTPPCADLIIEKKIPRVIIASSDPFEAVNGKGVQKLEAAGIEVKQAILKSEADRLNRRFFCYHKEKRPYIILKWAETKDGFIGRQQDDPKASDSWISSPTSKQLSHLWRAEEDAILVGLKTAQIDKPALTCRELEGQNPLRIVIDQKLELPESLTIFSTDANTLVVNEKREGKRDHIEFVKLDFTSDLLGQLMNALHQRNIQSMIVEGGTFTLQRFIEGGYWNEIRRFVGSKIFEKGVKAPTLEIKPQKATHIETDLLYTYYK